MKMPEGSLNETKPLSESGSAMPNPTDPASGSSSDQQSSSEQNNSVSTPNSDSKTKKKKVTIKTYSNDDLKQEEQNPAFAEFNEPEMTSEGSISVSSSKVKIDLKTNEVKEAGKANENRDGTESNVIVPTFQVCVSVEYEY